MSLYDKMLSKNFNDGLFSRTNIINTLHYIPDQLPHKYQPQYAVMELKFSSNNIPYGMYWLEYMDPLHRYLISYYIKWRKNNKDEKDNLLPFFLWLRNIGNQKYKSVMYLTKENLEQHLVYNYDKKIYYVHNSQPCSYNREQTFLFIIDLYTNIYILKENVYNHHSSISWCKPVLGSGNITINNGIITAISFYCGHYLPSLSNGLQSLKIFMNKNIFLPRYMNVTYYEKRKKTSTLEKLIPLL